MLVCLAVQVLYSPVRWSPVFSIQAKHWGKWCTMISHVQTRNFPNVCHHRWRSFLFLGGGRRNPFESSALVGAVRYVPQDVSGPLTHWASKNAHLLEVQGQNPISKMFYFWVHLENVEQIASRRADHFQSVWVADGHLQRVLQFPSIGCGSGHGQHGNDTYSQMHQTRHHCYTSTFIPNFLESLRERGWFTVDSQRKKTVTAKRIVRNESGQTIWNVKMSQLEICAISESRCDKLQH